MRLELYHTRVVCPCLDLDLLTNYADVARLLPDS